MLLWAPLPYLPATQPLPDQTMTIDQRSMDGPQDTQVSVAGKMESLCTVNEVGSSHCLSLCSVGVQRWGAALVCSVGVQRRCAALGMPATASTLLHCYQSQRAEKVPIIWSLPSYSGSSAMVGCLPRRTLHTRVHCHSGSQPWNSVYTREAIQDWERQGHQMLKGLQLTFSYHPWASVTCSCHKAKAAV